MLSKGGGYRGYRKGNGAMSPDYPPGVTDRDIHGATLPNVCEDCGRPCNDDLCPRCTKAHYKADLERDEK